jgi:hypothetical protein
LSPLFLFPVLFFEILYYFVNIVNYGPYYISVNTVTYSADWVSISFLEKIPLAPFYKGGSILLPFIKGGWEGF